MTKESLAELLNGREYGEEITQIEKLEAKNAGLVVVFGYSDDNIEFRGAIYEEYGCYGGGDVLFTKSGKIPNIEHMEAIELLQDLVGFKLELPLNKITATYAPWEYKTDIPHATFDIMEEGELYCKGIVFSIDDLK